MENIAEGANLKLKCHLRVMFVVANASILYSSLKTVNRALYFRMIGDGASGC